ncbi:glycosyltransferase family 4 protein [Rhodocytophaga rosea]|uniref:Glycosyltransferase family 4 protein n=1 Tax=Rhodocytophaga rosea TaxID=2704465 RepID=A0A6C0GCQ5_9BACT|nr:glycosyltransferase family 4 protein [Rhodocytophaga rosea]QHT65769.1 glycosyltransferase family 4 protein [Rhodocytophaga rosea]
MKILFITNNFPPIIDGVGDYTAHLSQQFIKNGHSVYIVCSTTNNSTTKPIQKSHLQVLPIIKDWSLDAVYKLSKEIKYIHPDYISLQYVPHAFNHYGIPYSICVLMFILKLYGYKITTTFHEVAIRFDWRQPKYIPIAINQRLISYFLALVSNYSITSIALYKKMLNAFTSKIYQIPIGSNIIQHEVNHEEVETLKRKLKPEDEFLICTFGANARRHDVLLNVIAQLSSTYKVRLLLIGKFPELWIQQMLKEAEKLKISDNVVVTGYLSSEDVYRHLLCADAFIQLENIMYDNWGGVSTKSGTLAAAYMAGLPIIGTKGDMTDSFFSDGHNILLCNNNTLPEVTSKIISLINSDSLRKHLKSNAYKTFYEYLDWEKIYYNYFHLLVNNTSAY